MGRAKHAFFAVTAGVAMSVMLGVRAETKLKVGLPLLFIDDTQIEVRSNVVRIVHQGKEDDRPVVWATEPWELDKRGWGNAAIYGSVYPNEDGSGFRMWYENFGRICVAESKDGVNWTKPILNLVTVAGSSSNNIVIRSMTSSSFLRDEFEKDPSRRYKVVGAHYYKRGDPRQGYYTMTSPDGLHWDMTKEKKIASWCDTCTLSQNPYTGEYLVYHKREVMDNGYTRRTVFLTKSRDFENWTEPIRVFGADETDDTMWRDNPRQFTDIYNMCVVGHAGGFLGIPSFFRMEAYIQNVDKSRNMSRHEGPLFLGIVTSPDGENWNRIPGRRPILPNRTYGVYNASHPGCSSGGAFLHVGDETWLYTYCSSAGHGTGYSLDYKHPLEFKPDYPPRSSVGRAVWRRWGFVSMESVGGFMRLKPLVLETPNLAINAKGKIKVSATTSDGKFFCAKFSGDATKEPLKWDREPPVGKPLKLQFEISGGALYSVECM